MKVFNFDSWVWKNLRAKFRKQGKTGLLYETLSSMLAILADRSVKLAWLRRQLFLETSDGEGLLWWGERYEREKEPGESDDAYKARLIAHREIRKKGATLETVKSVVSARTGIPREEIEVKKVFGSPESKQAIKIGGPLRGRIFSKAYTLYAWYIRLPALSPEFDRADLASKIDRLILGGNYPVFVEFGEPTPEPFKIGGPFRGPAFSRRANRTENKEVKY